MIQAGTQDKAKALYEKYKSGAFDNDPAAKAQAVGLLRKLAQTGVPAAPAPAAPQQEGPGVMDRLALGAGLMLSKFNAGLGTMATTLGDLPKNILGDQMAGPFTQPFSDLGHAIGDPLRESPHFQMDPERQQAVEEALPTIPRALASDLPGMAPLLMTGAAAPFVMAGEALSESLSPEAQRAAEESAKAAGLPPPSAMERGVNAAGQTMIAGAAGLMGPLGRFGKAVPGAESALEGLAKMAGRGAQDYAVTAGSSLASQGLAHATLNAPMDSDAANRAGIAGVALGRAVDAIPHGVEPNTKPGLVSVEFDPVAIHEPKQAPAEPVAAKTEEAKPTEVPKGPDRTEPVALKEVLPAPEDAKETGEWADTWIGDRDVANVNVDLRGAQHEQELKSAVPEEAFGTLLTRVAATGDRVSPQYRDADFAGLLRVNMGPELAEQYGIYKAKLSPDVRRIAEIALDPPKPVADIAKAISKENFDQGKMAEEAEAIEQARENYAAQLWKPLEEGGTSPTGTAKFTTTSGRQRARVYKNIFEGLADGRELAVPSMIEAQKIAAKQIHQVIADKKLIDLGLSNGLFTLEPGEGRAQIENPNFRKEAYVTDAKEGTEDGPLGNGTYVKGEKVFQKKPVYAPQDVADRLNRALGTSALNKVPGVKNLTIANNVAKQSMLLYSFFHHIAMTGAYVLGNPTSLKNINVVGGYKAGREMLKYPSSTMDELVRAGMTSGRAQDYEVHQLAERTRLETMIDGLPVVAQSKNVLKAIRDQQHDFLFHRFMPALKAHAADLEFNKALTSNRQALLDGTITRDEIARGVAVTMNNRFQSQNLMRLDRDPTAQHLFRLATLAPDWTESQIRFASQNFKPGFEGELARKSWARILFKGALATQTANLIASSFDDRSYWQRISDAYNSKDSAISGALRAIYSVDVSPLYHKTGGDDETAKYISLVNQYSFPFDFTESGPVDMLRGKTSPLARAIWDAGAGTDWAGKPITTLGELLGVDNKGVYSATGKDSHGGIHIAGEEKGGNLAGQTASYQSESKAGPIGWDQMPSWAAQEGMGVLPLEVQNTIAWVSGQHDGWDALLRSIGFRAQSADLQGMLRRRLEDQANHAKSLADKRVLEAQLRAFNKQMELKKQ